MVIETIPLAKAAMALGAALSIGLGGFGAGAGEGIAAGQASEAMSRNPKSYDAILKNMLVGMALAESATIFALVIALMLLFSITPNGDIVQIFTLIASGLCMGLGAIGSGIGSALPTGTSCLGTDRQPMMANKLTASMLVGSAVCQTPAIFAMVVSFILMFTNTAGQPVNPYWAAYLGAGLSTGLGAIGAGYGGGMAAQAGCEGAARQPEIADTMLKTTLVGQAVIQTTAIYGLLVSFVLIFAKSYESTASWEVAAAFLSAGIAVGLGGIGPGIGEGYVARCAIRGISRNSGIAALLTRTMLVAMAVVESCAIYALVVALILILVV